MDNLTKNQVLASSSGWVASLLNIFPGVGSGYIYQRRWLQYFITATFVTGWFIIGIILQGDKEPSQTEQIIGLSGLFIISIFTAVEANLAFKKSEKISSIKEEQKKSPTKKVWFK